MKHVWILLGLATVLTGCEKQIEEVSARDKAKQFAKASNYNVQLGLAYLKQGDRNRAKVKLMTALEEAPQSSEAHGALAYFFEKTGDMDRAGRYYQKSIGLAKTKGAALNNYGAFLCRQKHYIEANKLFVRASQDIHYVNTSGALENAGLCSLAIPDREMAHFYFKKAFDQDPKRYQSVYQLAKMAQEDKQYQDVLAYVEAYESNGSLQPELTWFGYQASKKLGLKAKMEKFAWVLKERFPKTRQYQQLLASNQDDSTKRVSRKHV